MELNTFTANEHQITEVIAEHIGDFTQFDSKKLQSFVVECNRGRVANFVPDREQAIARLTG